MPKRTTKKDAAIGQLLFFLGSISWLIYSISRHDILPAFWSGSFAIAFVCWLIAMHLPTTCGVITQKGHPCRNRTNGILFGCGSGKHIWAKVFARFGVRRKVPAGQNFPATSGNLHSEGVGQPTTVKVSGVQEKTNEAIVFWLTVISTGAGVVSMVTSIIAIA